MRQFDDLFRYVVPGGRPAPAAEPVTASTRSRTHSIDEKVAAVRAYAKKNAKPGGKIAWAYVETLSDDVLAGIIGKSPNEGSAVWKVRRWLKKEAAGWN